MRGINFGNVKSMDTRPTLKQKIEEMKTTVEPKKARKSAKKETTEQPKPTVQPETARKPVPNEVTAPEKPPVTLASKMEAERPATKATDEEVSHLFKEEEKLSKQAK